MKKSEWNSFGFLYNIMLASERNPFEISNAILLGFYTDFLKAFELVDSSPNLWPSERNLSELPNELILGIRTEQF